MGQINNCLDQSYSLLGESCVLSGCRLTTHLMVQPIVAEKIYTDPIMQGQGIMARFLIFDTPSIAGSRLLKDRNLTKGVSNDPMVIQYWETVKNLLDRKININEKTGELVLEPMDIQGDALKEWSVIHNSIEEQIASGCAFEGIKPFASKGAENVARIAAVLAFFEGDKCPNVKQIKRAGNIVRYYLKSMANRTKESEYEKEEILARDLFNWIKENGGTLKCNDFKLISPISIRSSKKARRILGLLVEKGYLLIKERNRHTGKASMWEINNPQQSAKQKLNAYTRSAVSAESADDQVNRKFS